MLRAILLTIGVLLLGVAPIAVLAGWPAHLIPVPAVLGIVLTAGILFERGRYKPPSSRRLGPDWVATSERFVDPDERQDRCGVLPTDHWRAPICSWDYQEGPGCVHNGVGLRRCYHARDHQTRRGFLTRASCSVWQQVGHPRGDDRRRRAARCSPFIQRGQIKLDPI